MAIVSLSGQLPLGIPRCALCCGSACRTVVVPIHSQMCVFSLLDCKLLVASDPFVLVSLRAWAARDSRSPIQKRLAKD